jgi:hypothetical protein
MGSESANNDQPERRWAVDESVKAQARRLVRCFVESEGHPPATFKELERWVSDNPDKIPLDGWGRLVPLFDDEDA